MQARVDTDQKLHTEREEMDYETLLEQVQMEAKMMQDRAATVHFFVSCFSSLRHQHSYYDHLITTAVYDLPDTIADPFTRYNCSSLRPHTSNGI